MSFSKEFDKKYDSQNREKKILDFWNKNKIYEFDKDSKKKVFSIDTPPPTLSGKMHIGHAFSYTQNDFIARYKKMSGFEVFFPFGTDDNGLATEKLVQKEEKVDLRKCSREEANKIVENYLQKERPKFIYDWQKLGISCDFENLKYSTIDNFSQKISQKSFLELAKKNLIYRKKGPIPWDRVFQTTIAQAELEDKTMKSKMNYIKAKLEGVENTYIIYATTRPEMIFACHGFSVEDVGNYVKLEVGEEFWILGEDTYEKVMEKIETSYKIIEKLKGKDLIGKNILIPLINRTIEITHDKSIKADLGTGAAYFCSFGGVEDIEYCKRHDLKIYDILNLDGTLNNSCNTIYSKANNQYCLIFIKKENKYLSIKKRNIFNKLLNNGFGILLDLEEKEIKEEILKVLKNELNIIGKEEDLIFRGVNQNFIENKGSFLIKIFTLEKFSGVLKKNSFYENMDDYEIDEVDINFIDKNTWEDRTIWKKEFIDNVFFNYKFLYDKDLKLLRYYKKNENFDINSNEIEIFEGLLASEEGRWRMIKKLKEIGVLVKQETIEHIVNVGERSGVPVEYISSTQWFVKYLDRKKYFLEMAKKFNWTPKHYINRLENWIKGLNWDWGFSRQRHFGIPIPVWYGKESGKIYYADVSQLPCNPLKDLPLNHKEINEELIPEKDVFDTWFTSASTPDIALNILGEEFRNKNYPMNLRPQGHDIINFWLFYTMAKNNLLYDKNPFLDVNVCGWVLAEDGTKMSKSKGNTISPQEIVEKYSNDSLRYAAASTKLGLDQPFQEKEVQSGTKVVNKLYNCAKFAKLLLDDFKEDERNFNFNELSGVDKWVISKLQKVIKESKKELDKYNYEFAKSSFVNFFMIDFCDYYIEIVKKRLYEKQENYKSAQKTLYYVLFNCLKGISIFMPFIVEEIYQILFKNFEKEISINKLNYPIFEENLFEEKYISFGNYLIEIIKEIRKYKSQNQMSLKDEVEKIEILAKKETINFIEENIIDFKNSNHIKKIEFKENKELKINF